MLRLLSLELNSVLPINTKYCTALNYDKCSRTGTTTGEDCYELYQVFVTILENVVTLVIAVPGTKFVWVENH